MQQIQAKGENKHTVQECVCEDLESLDRQDTKCYVWENLSQPSTFGAKDRPRHPSLPFLLLSLTLACQLHSLTSVCSPLSFSRQQGSWLASTPCGPLLNSHRAQFSHELHLCPSTYGSLGYASRRAFFDTPFLTSPAIIRPAIDAWWTRET